MRYQCKQHEVLDDICKRHYGEEHGYTEMVLAANPSLAAQGTHLPLGLVIELPEVEQATTVEQPLQLWD